MSRPGIGARARRWAFAMIVALSLGAGSFGVTNAQDSNGSISVNQGNGTGSSQGNDESGPQTQEQGQDEGQGTLGASDTDQVNAAENTTGQEQGQSSESVQDSTNGASQGNAAAVSDIGGDDISSDDDATGVNGDGNSTTPLLEEDDLVDDSGIIGVLIAILLSILSTSTRS